MNQAFFLFFFKIKETKKKKKQRKRNKKKKNKNLESPFHHIDVCWVHVCMYISSKHSSVKRICAMCTGCVHFCIFDCNVVCTNLKWIVSTNFTGACSHGCSIVCWYIWWIIMPSHMDVCWMFMRREICRIILLNIEGTFACFYITSIYTFII